MKKIYENSSCRVFPGFYESWLYNSDTLCNFDSDVLPENYCWEFPDGEYQKFEKDTCEKWISAIKDSFDDNPLNMEIGSLKNLWSPRFYNFQTDRISFDVKVNLNSLKKFCFKDNREDFDKYLHEHWSSYDGFISFIPNSVFSFENDYKEGNGVSTLQDIMIEYYLLKFVNFDDVMYDTCESEFERLHEHVALQNTEDLSLWEYEYDSDTDKVILTTKIA